MKNRTGFMTLAAAAAAMGTLWADPVTLTAGDAGGTTSFTAAGHWSDGAAPSADKDYLVALGTTDALRTPASTAASASATFKGNSLTIGVVDGTAGRVIHKAAGGEKGCVITHHNLYLAKGTYHSGENGESVVRGNSTITSPESAPFMFQGSQNRKMMWYATVAGAAGTCFGAGRTAGENSGRSYLDLYGNNSNYHGKMVVDGNDIILRINANNSVGAGFDEATPDAVTLRNWGGFGGGDVSVTIDRGNAGVWVEATGGTLFAGGVTTTDLKLPVAGPGNVRKNGGGTLRCFANWDAGDLEIIDGTIAFVPASTIGASCTSFTVPAGKGFGASNAQLSGRAMANNGTFYPNGIGTVDAAPVALGANHTVTSILFDNTPGGCDQVVLGADCTVTAWPMSIGLATYGPQVRNPVLKIPTSVRAVTAADFTNISVADPLGLITATIEVEPAGNDGLQTVYLVQNLGLVSQVTTDKYFPDAATWDDGRTPHDDAAYVCYKKLLRTGAESTGTILFPGALLYLYSDDQTRADLRVKCTSLTVEDLRLGPKTIVTGGKSSSNGRQYLAGKVTMMGNTTLGRSCFGTEAGRSFEIQSTIVGSGAASVMNYGSGLAHIYLTGDNSGFTGSWQVGETSNTEALHTILHVSSKAQIGGNPAALDNAGLAIYGTSVLKAEGTFTLDDPNRAICFNNGYVEVDEGKTLTLGSKLVFNGDGHKTGAGGLVVYNTARTSNSKTFHIHQGKLTLLCCEPVGSAVLRFYSGSSLTVPAFPTDEPQQEFGVFLSNTNGLVLDGMETLPMDIDFSGGEVPPGSFTVPLLTVRDATADAIRGKIDLTSRPSKVHLLSLVEEVVTWPGDSYTSRRFSAVYTYCGGTVIFVR